VEDLAQHRAVVQGFETALRSTSEVPQA